MFWVTYYPMISKTKSGRVSKELPGSGSGSGTRWALHPDLLVIQQHPLFQITPVLNTGLSLFEPLHLYQKQSLAKLAAVIRCSAEVAAKSSPNAGASLSTWAERLRARSLPQDSLGSSPERSQAGDHTSWGHQMPPCNLSL